MAMDLRQLLYTSLLKASPHVLCMYTHVSVQSLIYSPNLLLLLLPLYNL